MYIYIYIYIYMCVYECMYGRSHIDCTSTYRLQVQATQPHRFETVNKTAAKMQLISR